MLLIKISNIQSLNHGLQLDWPILEKSKRNSTKVSASKKIHTEKKIMKGNSKPSLILYLYYFGSLKNLITNNTLVTTKKP